MKVFSNLLNVSLFTRSLAFLPVLRYQDLTLKLYSLASMKSREVLKHCLDSSRHALPDAIDSWSASSYGLPRPGCTLSEKVVFFATLTAYCRQVWQKKPSNPYITELVLRHTPQKYMVWCRYDAINSINSIDKFH